MNFLRSVSLPRDPHLDLSDKVVTCYLYILYYIYLCSIYVYVYTFFYSKYVFCVSLHSHIFKCANIRNPVSYL